MQCWSINSDFQGAFLPSGDFLGYESRYGAHLQQTMPQKDREEQERRNASGMSQIRAKLVVQMSCEGYVSCHSGGASRSNQTKQQTIAGIALSGIILLLHNQQYGFIARIVSSLFPPIYP